MNPYLILSGIGMLLVGAIAPLLWWWRKKIEIKFFHIHVSLINMEQDF